MGEEATNNRKIKSEKANISQYQKKKRRLLENQKEDIARKQADKKWERGNKIKKILEVIFNDEKYKDLLLREEKSSSDDPYDEILSRVEDKIKQEIDLYKKTLENSYNLDDFYKTATDEETSLHYKQDVLREFLDIEYKLLLEVEKRALEQKELAKKSSIGLNASPQQIPDTDGQLSLEETISWNFNDDNLDLDIQEWPLDEPTVVEKKEEPVPVVDPDIPAPDPAPVPVPEPAPVPDKSDTSDTTETTDTSEEPERNPILRILRGIQQRRRIPRSERVKIRRRKRLPRKKWKTATEVIEVDDEISVEDKPTTLRKYKGFHPGFDENLTDDIYSERAFKLDLVIPELISRPFLVRFFKSVIESFAKYNRDLVEEEFIANPSEYLDSAPIRGRMVFFEATNNNLEDIADALVNASNLERVVVTGLDESKKDQFKQQLLQAWEGKINQQKHSKAYRKRLLDALNQKADTAYTSLEQFSIEALTGPHTFISNSDISYDNLKDKIGDSFSSKLDEIIIYGDDNELADHLPQLARQSEVKQYVAVKVNEPTEEDSPIWIGSFKKTVERPMRLLTSSKDSRDIFVKTVVGKNEHLRAKGKIGKLIKTIWQSFDKEVIKSTNQNFDLNPRFEAIINANSELKEKDRNYLRTIFTHRTLYPPNLSLISYSSTATKTKSGIDGEGALVVGEALPQGNAGLQVATARGALFGVNANMFDTGNDMNLEDQHKMLVYKAAFQHSFRYHNEQQGNSVEVAYERALEDLVLLYISIEKRKSIIRNEEKGLLARIDNLVNANKTNRKNRLGVNFLLPLPFAVTYGYVATIVGTTAALTGAALSIAFPIIGATVAVTAGIFLACSLYKQMKANAENLTRWSRGSVRAHTFMKTAQDKREHYIKDVLEKLTHKNNTESIQQILQKQESIDAKNSQGSEKDEELMEDPVFQQNYIIIARRKSEFYRRIGFKKVAENLANDADAAEQQLREANGQAPGEAKEEETLDVVPVHEQQLGSGAVEESKGVDAGDETTYTIYGNDDIIPDLIPVGSDDEKSIVFEHVQFQEEPEGIVHTDTEPVEDLSGLIMGLDMLENQMGVRGDDKTETTRLKPESTAHIAPITGMSVPAQFRVNTEEDAQANDQDLFHSSNSNSNELLNFEELAARQRRPDRLFEDGRRDHGGDSSQVKDDDSSVEKSSQDTTKYFGAYQDKSSYGREPRRYDSFKEVSIRRFGLSDFRRRLSSSSKESNTSDNKPKYKKL